MYQLEVECEYWLEKANEYVQDYLELSDYDFLFEADQSEESNNNQRVKNNTDTAIGNAARAVIKMIENLLSKIRNWLKNKFSKQRLANLKENLGQSGKGNTQIKTANTSKIKNAWNSIFTRLDGEVNKATQEAESAPESSDTNEDGTNDGSSVIQEIENMVKDKLANLGDNVGDVANMGSAWVTTLTAEAALRAATTDAQTAEDILVLLENDKKLMEKLERDLGEARAKSYKRKIKSLSKNISFVRLRAKLRGQYMDSLMDATTSVVEDVEHIVQNGLKGMSDDQVKGSFSTALSNEERRKSLRRADLAGKIVTNQNNSKGVVGAARGAAEAHRQSEHIRHIRGDERPNKEQRKEKRKKILNTLLYGTNGKPE